MNNKVVSVYQFSPAPSQVADSPVPDVRDVIVALCESPLTGPVQSHAVFSEGPSTQFKYGPNFVYGRVRIEPYPQMLVDKGVHDLIGDRTTSSSFEANLGPHFATAYRKLGRQPTNALVWRQWRGRVENWLIEKLAEEDDLQRAEAISSVLVELGAFGPVLDRLTSNPDGEEARQLLRALEWMRIPRSQVRRCTSVLRGFLGSDDNDVAEAACYATRALPRLEAFELLQEVAGTTKNDELSELVADEFRERS